MDKEQTREVIHVMQHWADGGRVEGRRRDYAIWGECCNPCWDWADYDYRIASDEPDESDIGTMVEVSECFNLDWVNRKLVGLIEHNRKFVCEIDGFGGGLIAGWPYARRIKEQP